MNHLQDHATGTPFPGSGVRAFSLTAFLSLSTLHLSYLQEIVKYILVKGADLGGKILTFEFWFPLFLAV